ncbi:MAG: hypothetical protein B7733_19700 [Myxococcales bacterium FL481]|nr:MAG: hypothetical protein B7733_19700 [Myxococcales bacterium FL481]
MTPSLFPRRCATLRRGARRAFPPLLLLSAFAARPAVAAEPASPAPGPAPITSTQATCELLEARAAAEATLEMSPSIYASAATSVFEPQFAQELGSRDLTPRFRFGLGFRPSRFRQGRLRLREARLECQQATVLATVHRDADGSLVVADQLAHRAMADVLAAEIEQARGIAARLRDRLTTHRATLTQVHAVELKVAALEEQQARTKAAIVDSPPSPPRVHDATAQLDALSQTERELLDVQAKMRRSRAWDIRLVGGYESIVGVRQALPIFGLATVEWRPASLQQAKWERRARAAQAKAALVRRQQATAKRQTDLDVVRQELASTRERLAAAATLDRDLAQRHTFLLGLAGDDAAAFADQVLLDRAGVKAKVAFLQARAASLANSEQRLVAGLSTP